MLFFRSAVGAPTCNKNFRENKNIPTDILDELYQILLKKFIDKPKYSINILYCALLSRYTSTQAYKILLKKFPLPSSTFLLRKLNKGGLEPIKVLKSSLSSR